MKLQETYLPSDKSTKWPLNGGVPCHLSLHGERKVERLYIAGYQDGTVRIWDATYPILSPIFVLDPEVCIFSESITQSYEIYHTNLLMTLMIKCLAASYHTM